MVIPIERGRCVTSESPTITFSNGNQTPHTFAFDSVFDEKSSQVHVRSDVDRKESLFEGIGKDITNHCLRGYNGCIFAYGQTGSGKTYTIFGPSREDATLSLDSKSKGLLPRTLEYLFDQIHIREAQENVHYSCFVSFMEIYNEKMRDLLNPTGTAKLYILKQSRPLP